MSNADGPMPTPFSFDVAARRLTERASRLTKQLMLETGCDSPPFSPTEYARLTGIGKVTLADLGELSGALLRFGDSYEIRLNAKHVSVRRNFSCAHEVGHVLLTELGLDSRLEEVEYRSFSHQGGRPLRKDPKERLCDIAATELLMPESVFLDRLKEFGLYASTIASMARMFKVSLTAAAMRIAEVSSDPCAVLLWQRDKAQSKSPGLRLNWCIGPGKQPLRTEHYEPVKRVEAMTTTLFRAYREDSPVTCRRLFSNGRLKRSLIMDSQGFGGGEHRYVLSVVPLGDTTASG